MSRLALGSYSKTLGGGGGVHEPTNPTMHVERFEGQTWFVLLLNEGCLWWLPACKGLRPVTGSSAAMSTRELQLRMLHLMSWSSRSLCLMKKKTGALRGKPEN